MTNEMADRIAKHYEHAREKHPYFADKLFPFVLEGRPSPTSAKRLLDTVRGILKKQIAHGRVTAEMVHDCEMSEVRYAIECGDKAHAVEECYDAIAVLLRMVDVLEGRQELGDPAKKHDAKKEGDAE